MSIHIHSSWNNIPPLAEGIRDIKVITITVVELDNWVPTGSILNEVKEYLDDTFTDDLYPMIHLGEELELPNETNAVTTAEFAELELREKAMNESIGEHYEEGLMRTCPSCGAGLIPNSTHCSNDKCSNCITNYEEDNNPIEVPYCPKDGQPCNCGSVCERYPNPFNPT